MIPITSCYTRNQRRNLESSNFVAIPIEASTSFRKPNWEVHIELLDNEDSKVEIVPSPISRPRTWCALIPSPTPSQVHRGPIDALVQRESWHIHQTDSRGNGPICLGRHFNYKRVECKNYIKN